MNHFLNHRTRNLFMMVSEVFDPQTSLCTNRVHAGIMVVTRNDDGFKFEGKGREEYECS